MPASRRRCRTAPALGTDADLAVALGLALTGELLPLTSADAVVAELAELGWTPGALAELRHGRQERREPWPFPVEVERLRSVGFARFDAALAEARRVSGLTGLEPARPATRPMNADERRLIQDRPPHWG